ncbi:hypothetical protein COCVIDRAFT_32161 [Bipolaris victoriae FI3]|uniref:Uncharacterized protein n=1 Tax=Bipolaris victoriae (strain FI3) TaxID=930091 RepID=W7DWQ8_BIPV3|nr:hypothetical protein COCVIDRAFT_32161 [Bipolaris victoriae FI3]
MRNEAEQKQLIEEYKDSEELRIREAHPKVKFLTYKVVMLTIWSLCLVFWTGMLLATSKPTWPASRTLHCGNSTAEAKSLGCVYDILSGDWMPEQCFDKETMNEYEEAGPWLWWADREGTQTLSREETSERTSPGPPYYGTPLDHAAHCLYTFKRMIKLRDQWGRLPPSSSTEWHTNHCVGFLMSFITATKETSDPVTYRKYSSNAGFSTCVVGG